jgi:hypothetical protein
MSNDEFVPTDYVRLVTEIDEDNRSPVYVFDLHIEIPYCVVVPIMRVKEAFGDSYWLFVNNKYHKYNYDIMIELVALGQVSIAFHPSIGGWFGF